MKRCNDNIITTKIIMKNKVVQSSPAIINLGIHSIHTRRERVMLMSYFKISIFIYNSSDFLEDVEVGIIKLIIMVDYEIYYYYC